jgi:hypothetical protein
MSDNEQFDVVVVGKLRAQMTGQLPDAPAIEL